MAELTAVVTGAGAGIGLAIVARLLADGYRVIGIGRRRAVLDDAAQSFESGRERFEPREADVRDPVALDRALEKVGSIHAVVASAGIVRQSRLDEADAPAIWREVLSVNLDGVFHTLRAAEPHLADSGRVVVISSGLGKVGREAFGAYAASKHGVLGLVRCVAKELAPRKITVNAICPGWVDTAMARSDLERFAEREGSEVAEIEARVTRGIPLGRFVRPSEVAALVGWLVSSDAAAITGEALNVSCGESFG